MQAKKNTEDTMRNEVILCGELVSMNKSDSGKLLKVTVKVSNDGEHRQTLSVNFFGDLIAEAEKVLDPAKDGDLVQLTAFVSNNKYKDTWSLQLNGTGITLR